MKRLLPAVVALALLSLALFVTLRGPARGGPAPADPRAPASGVSPPAPRGTVGPVPIAPPPPAPPPAPVQPRPRDRFATGSVVVKGSFGSAPGQFGRRAEPESNPEAPMALAVSGTGEVAIVDQVNHRVQRFQGGKLASQIATGGDTIQDLALAPDGRTVLLDRLADKNVQIYDPAGTLQNEVPLLGPGVPEGGAVTGVFTDETGAVYVERQHEALVRVAGANGLSDRAREELPGRPTRDGKLLIAAAMVDRAAGQVVVRATDRASRQPAWTAPLTCGAPILRILLLDSDRAGRVYLAVACGHEAQEPPFALVDEGITVFRVDAGGAPRGTLELPPLPAAEESFRPLSIDGDGAVYEMSVAPGGVTVMRYGFP